MMPPLDEIESTGDEPLLTYQVTFPTLEVSTELPGTLIVPSKWLEKKPDCTAVVEAEVGEFWVIVAVAATAGFALSTKRGSTTARAARGATMKTTSFLNTAISDLVEG